MATVRTLSSINDIGAQDWNACVSPDDPFTRHAFFKALEDSTCVHPKNGWLARHLVLEDQGRVMICIPLYLKSHSYGEYVFDWSWADAYQRAGGQYYPKLQCAVPFSPVSGHRLLCHPDATKAMRLQAIQALIGEATAMNVSSLHVTFMHEDECDLMADNGFLKRVGHQYHFHNNNYQCFDDFLNAMTSRKRKAIRKERQKVQNSGIEIEVLSGADITESHWDPFYQFYLNTSGRKWGHAYLNRDFFSQLGQTMGAFVVLVMARDESGYVAGALNLKGENTLYGRYWGCLAHYDFLHFEACYYQAIDYAISHGLKRIEAGAQGEHKIQRGYLPTETYSAHWIAESSFRQAVLEFLIHEKEINQREMEILSTHTPFKSI